MIVEEEGPALLGCRIEAAEACYVLLATQVRLEELERMEMQAKVKRKLVEVDQSAFGVR